MPFLGRVVALTLPTIALWAGMALWPRPGAEPVPVPRPRPEVVVRDVPMPTGGMPFEQIWQLRGVPPRERVIVPDLPTNASEALWPVGRPPVRRKVRGLCETHGLRKVVTNNGRSWRCKR
jgi:hypothetical protein